MEQPTADLAAVVVVFDWLETEFKDWKSPTEDRPFEVEYQDPGDMMAEYIREKLEEHGWEMKWIEGPNVTAAVAITIEVEASADVSQLVRDVNSVIPWIDGSRGEVCEETQNDK